MQSEFKIYIILQFWCFHISIYFSSIKVFIYHWQKKKKTCFREVSIPYIFIIYISQKLWYFKIDNILRFGVSSIIKTL
jgi:hypothetical protein